MTHVGLLQESVSLGSSGTADIQMSGPHVAAEHAQLTQKGSRMTCTALQGDADDLMSRTYTWVNGSEIRKGGNLEAGQHNILSGPVLF